MISQAAPCRLKGEAFCLNGSQYGFVASNACVDYGGHIIIAKKNTLCSGGKENGFIPDENVFWISPFLIVKASGCLAEGGRLMRRATHIICDGGDYDGFIANSQE